MKEAVDFLQLNRRQIRSQIIVAVLITAAAIAGVLYVTWQDDSWHALRSLDRRFVFAAVALVFLGWTVDGWRLQAMTRAVGYDIPFLTALRTNLLGYFLSAVTPFTAGGGALQVYSLTRAGLTVGHGTAAVLVTGFVAQLGLALASVVIVFGFGMTILPDSRLEQVVRIGIVVYAAVVLGLVWITWHIDKGRRFIAAVVRWTAKFVADEDKVHRAAAAVDRIVIDIHNGLHLMFAPGRGGWAAAGTVLTLLYHGVQFAVLPVLALGLGPTVSVLPVIAVQAPVYLLASVLPTPGGSGGLEFGLTGALLQWLTPGQAGVVTVVGRLITYYFVLAAGGVAAFFFLRFEWHRFAGTREADPEQGAGRAPTAPVSRKNHGAERKPPGPPLARIALPDSARPSDALRTRNLDRY